MEILFKEHKWLYYINKYGHLVCSNDAFFDTIDTTNVSSLYTTNVLYHYTHEDTSYPVYYEYNNRIITVIDDRVGFDVISINDEYIKDYTLVNLKLL